MSQQIAIIGAGLAGLAAAKVLSKKHNVTIFYEEGRGASKIATGLLHPYAGAKCKLNFKGKEGLAATLALINSVKPSAILKKGIYRLGFSEELLKRLKSLSLEEEEVDWIGNGVLIHNGYAIDTPLYLEALKSSCKAQFIPQKVRSLKELKSFDKIIVAAGAWTTTIEELKDLPITPNKGQLLKVASSSIKDVLITKGYIVPINSQELILGATFEKKFVSEEPDLELAKAEIYPLVKLIVGDIDSYPVLECRTSLRASTPGHLPLIKEVLPNCYIFTGLGSKGLLYHALYASQFEDLIP